MSASPYAVHPNCASNGDDSISGRLKSPCGGTYRCHGCNRFVGWCFGAHDEHPDFCDDCWYETDVATT